MENNKEFVQHAINRLGFGVWADNEVMNFLEDWRETMLMGDGNMTIERNDDCNIWCKFQDKQVEVRLRVYIDDEGWQTHERNINLNPKQP